jgi:hypothetical protein
MGGQACVLYGAAEFSRDIDLAVLENSRNLSRLDKVLSELNAEPIAIPIFSIVNLFRFGLGKRFFGLKPEELSIMPVATHKSVVIA